MGYSSDPCYDLLDPLFQSYPSSNPGRLTHLLVILIFWVKGVVNRLESQVDVWEIMQPVSPPRCDVVYPCGRHHCKLRVSNIEVRFLMVSGQPRSAVKVLVPSHAKQSIEKRMLLCKKSLHLRLKMQRVCQITMLCIPIFVIIGINNTPIPFPVNLSSPYNLPTAAVWSSCSH